MHFGINVSIVDLVGKVVLFYNPGRKKLECSLHVFVPVKGGRKVKKIVSRHMNLALGVLSMLFQCSFTVIMSAGLFDEITPCCDSDAIGALFLWAVDNQHSDVCDDLVLRNLSYDGSEHEEHCICPYLSRFVVALTHLAKVFSKCCHSNFCSGWIFRELGIATDGCFGDWMNHRHCIMLKVDGGGHVGAQLEGCVVCQIVV
jgi:hypothetical protein